jgi:hopanoid biosynthesis associated RND transporter like protein HpnN
LLTAGFATLAVGELNLISVAFAVLYIGLGVDFAIHLCLHYRESVRAGETGQAALNSAVRGVGPSLVLCAITTAVGFFAFIPTTYSGVSELGLISGTGMFISLAVSLTLLPALLSAWPMRDAHRQADLKWGGWKTSLTKWPYRHAHTVRWAVVLIGLSALLTLPNVQFDNNPINLRNPETESVATFRDLVENSSTSPWSATILASDAAQADAYQVQLNQLASVDKAVAIGYFVPSDQKDKLVIIEDIALLLGPELGSGPRGALPSIDEQLKAYASFEDVLDAFIASPKDLPWRKTIAELRQNLKLFANQLTGAGIEQVSNRFSELQQSLLHYLPNSLHLLETSLGATEFSLKELPTDLVDRWISKQGIYRIEVFPKKDISDNDALREFVADIRTVAPEATGDPVVSLEAAAVVVTAFQQAFAGALIVITLILILIMGGLIEALFVLVPLLLAGLLTVALFVLSGAAFNFANIIALPLLLGMGVDNGIHMVNRIRNTASVHSINLLKTSTARAVLFSALTTMVSFGNLSFSSHPGTASMGKILTLGVLMTLLSTLIILPALLPQSRSILRHSDRG